jgi:hypothetical protein
VSKLAIVAMILLAAFGNGQPLFAEGQYLNARCVRGLATGAGVLNAGRPALSDSPSASVNERDFRIESHARPQRSLRRRCHFSAAACSERSTAYDPHRQHRRANRHLALGVAFA